MDANLSRFHDTAREALGRDVDVSYHEDGEQVGVRVDATRSIRMFADASVAEINATIAVWGYNKAKLA